MKTYYGLPEKVTFCKKCVISNQRPASTVEFKHNINSKKVTMNIDDDGICDACRTSELKENINWDQREKELVELLDKYRKNDGSYDCLIPGSGGKDSAALAVHMNKKYPDLDIEYFFTDTGYELKETYDFLNKLKTRLDKPIHYINPRNSFDYYLKKYNNFLPSATARWCTIEMKLKSMEAWLKPALDAGREIITYVGIRYDERGRIGYKPTNNLIKAKFPFI